jgi:hypothetical protein
VRALPAVIVGISLALALDAAATVSVRAYRCDGQTPLPLKDPNLPDVYSDIMVGTHLVLIVSSDTAEYWWGGLQMTWDDWEIGTLAGRGHDPNIDPLNYAGSCLEAAGMQASVSMRNSPSQGPSYQLQTDTDETLAGDWFVLDYYAETAGFCDISLSSYYCDPSSPIPLCTFVVERVLSFTHVPSRDFSGDNRVDFLDFALLASQWRGTIAPSSEALSAFDLDEDGLMGPADLALFSEHWLDLADCNEAAVDSSGGGPSF